MGKGRLEAKKVTRLGRESEKKEKTNCSVGTDKREEMFIVFLFFVKKKTTLKSKPVDSKTWEGTVNWPSAFFTF